MIEYINRIRVALSIPENNVEVEKGIKGSAGFYWGFPDGHNVLSENSRLFFEIENGQHHPDTNVLKYWPILEENKDLKIILIQWIIKKPKSRNRWELSKFLGSKMEGLIPDRFLYFFLEYEELSNTEKLRKIRDCVNNI